MRRAVIHEQDMRISPLGRLSIEVPRELYDEGGYRAFVVVPLKKLE